MTKSELTEAVQNWLAQEEIELAPNDEGQFSGWMTGKNGCWRLRLICEDDPSLLHVICHHPLRIPEPRLPAVRQLLLVLNGQLRLGAYSLSESANEPILRVTIPITSPEDISLPFCIANSIFDDALLTLARFISSDATEIALPWFSKKKARPFPKRWIPPELN